jgi:hypothetical protein
MAATRASAGPQIWSVDTARSGGAAVLGAVAKPLTAAKLAPLLAQHRHDQRQAAAGPVMP